MSINHKVIDIINNADSVDWRAIGIALAKHHPSILIKMYNKTNNRIQAEASRLIRGGGKVQAIKYLREHTAMDLKEALAEVNRIIEEEGIVLC